MKKSLVILSALALISALLMIWGEYQGPPALVYITKPLTMACILSIAFQGAVATGSRYGTLIVAGIVLSMVGDILLMLPSDKFVEGLVAFLLAHMLYVTAFVYEIGWRGSFRRAILFALYGILVGILLWTHLGELWLPVAIYIVVILLMGWRAWERSAATGSRGARWAFWGALLFILSDTILALNKFRQPFLLARALNLSTYFLAQWLIANSAVLWQRSSRETG